LWISASTKKAEVGSRSPEPLVTRENPIAALVARSRRRRGVITVDKPPVSQWVMGLSGQLFADDRGSCAGDRKATK
jgi:hypothetical protein